MGYTVENKYGVLAVNDSENSKKPKEIRFITPEYNEKFRISDGEQILISYPEGVKKAFVCRYIDEYHMLIGRNAFHICEFAELADKLGLQISPFPEKRVIWSNIDLNFDDWKNDLKEEYPGLSESEYYEKMTELNDMYLDDERANLDIDCEDIICIGDIGRWNGRVSGYKVLENCKFSDFLKTECEYAEWFVDRDGELRSREIHHDGTNYILYRVFKEDASYDDRNDLIEKIYEGKATQKEIDRFTEKIGIKLGELIYGWDFPTKEKERVSERDTR